jgi:hypothetical protein
MLSLFAWSIADATKAAHNALDMGDFAGVVKYMGQVTAFTDRAARLDAARRRGRARVLAAKQRTYRETMAARYPNGSWL